MTYFKSGMAGSHNFKIGGEWFRETFTDERGIERRGRVPGDVLHILNNGAPARGVSVRHAVGVGARDCATSGCIVQDTWRVNSRLTFNLGLRLDRYRAFLPEQEGPPVGRFNPTQLTFPAVDNVNTFNKLVPRARHGLRSHGRGPTVLKANWGRYAWNPGTAHRRRTSTTNRARLVPPVPLDRHQRQPALRQRRRRRDHRPARRRRQRRSSIRTSRTR